MVPTWEEATGWRGGEQREPCIEGGTPGAAQPKGKGQDLD